MSLRQVLTIYNAERQLSDDETALLNTLRKMTDAERGMFVEGLTDKSQKKAGKKSASKSGSKSSRASGMASAISRSLESSRKATVANDDDEFKRKVQEVVLDDDTVRCQFTRADNRPCHLLPDHNIHHLESATEYHPFVPPAQPADGLSSASNAATGSTASSATEKGAVGNAAGGSNG